MNYSIFLQALAEIGLEISLGYLIKTGIKKIPDGIKNRPTLPSLKWHRASVQRSGFINRTEEMNAIQNAIGESGATRLLYFYGPGGIGKTRLIEQVQKEIEKYPRKKRPYWGGMYDLYHADLHDVLELQSEIVQRMNQDGRNFQEYLSAREEFENARQQGYKKAHMLQAELDTLFIANLCEFSRQQNRLIIAFDTVETLTLESELIQSICQIENTPLAMRVWLLQNLKLLENSVILLAGRPDPGLKRDLDTVSGENAGLVESIMLRQLTRKESHDLLKTLLVSAPNLSISLNKSDELWKLTEGNPVLLTLVVELLKQVDQFDLLETDLNPQEFGKNLISRLFNYDDLAARTFFFLALARQGLTPELLHYLEPSWSAEECENRLSEAAKLGIVKTRIGRNEIFLHDALYEFFDQYSPPRSALLPWYERIADYYHSRLNRTGISRKEWAQTVVKLLYYELQVNPKLAFEKYFMHWDEMAIRGFELGLDMQLRNEILRFIRSPLSQKHSDTIRLSPAVVERDSTLRWIKRYLIQSRYENALKISETVIEFCPKQYRSVLNLTLGLPKLLPEKRQEANMLFNLDDPFFWGQLFSLYGETLVYIGELNSSTQMVLKKATSLLQQALHGSSFLFKEIHERSLGWAYDRLGYLSRSNGRYGQALNFYEQALIHYEKANVKDEQANTLNNMSFVQANLGLVEKAFTQVNRALTIRQQLGQDYPIALSFNTRGRIQVLRGRAELGVRDCQTALNIFEDIESARGIGLAANALGWGCRKRATLLFDKKADWENVIHNFQSAIEFFERAASIFSESVDEPIRLWETLNELGSVYRDWGDCIQTMGQKQFQHMYNQAQEYYNQALEIAEEHNLLFQLADTHDDLAQLAVSQSNPELMDSWLNQVNNLISDYSETHDRLEQGDAYWLVLGKIYWQRASWNIQLIKQGQLTEEKEGQTTKASLNFFTLALVHFQKYWPDTAFVKDRYKKMVSLLVSANMSANEINFTLAEVATLHNCNILSQGRIIQRNDPVIVNEPAFTEKTDVDVNTFATKLFQILCDHFDLEELRTLCFHLSVEYDDLRGEGRSAKARELIKFMQRTDQLDLLEDTIQQLRPDIC